MFWLKADVRTSPINVRYWPKADIPIAVLNVRYSPNSDQKKLTLRQPERTVANGR
jgi:hypothetical protein